MDYMGILKRAFHVTWDHKVLWFFGFLRRSLAPAGAWAATAAVASGTTMPGRPGAFPGFQVTTELVVAMVIGVHRARPDRRRPCAWPATWP